MIKHRWLSIITMLLMTAAVIFVGIGFLMPSAFDGTRDSSEPAYVAAMDKTKVLDIQIIADEEKWSDMLENATSEEYIPATVIIDGVKIENVGIRPKGNSSLSMVAQDDTTDRYSFKIEFDKYVTGQTWLGLDKIVVNNMQGDSTYMKEYLSYDIMAYAGVGTPLYTFSDISVNGQSWGFYLAVEALEESYASRVYGDDYGKLYKPESMEMGGNVQRDEFLASDNERSRPGEGFGSQSGGITLQYTDDEISSYSAIFENSVFKSSNQDHLRVINALKKLDAGEDLESVVDVQATLKYFAAHTVIVNLDSYVSNMGHNYYLYEKDGQLTMLPWDFNLAFGGFQSGDASSIVNFPIDTPVSGVSLEDRPILAKLLEVPEYLEMYHSYLQQIVDEYFNSGLFSQTIDSLNTLISSYVEADPSAFYDYTSYQSGVEELKKLGILRAQSMEGQLNGTIPSTTAGQETNPDTLIDTSDINLSALGSMGGGKGEMPGNQPMENDRSNLQNFDRAAIEKAMEILRSAGDDELTEEQLNQLQDLGFTEEQITMFRTREQSGPDSSNKRPSDMQMGMNPTAVSAVSGLDTWTWIVAGSSTALLFGGLLFVMFYKRRRYC